MKKLYRFVLLPALLVAFHSGFGQSTTTQAPPIFTADSLATGNYKDVLSSFFQLAFNNLTGPNKELKFTSNPFAVMAKMDPALLVDTNYYRYRHLRKLNFAFAGKLDSSYRFNGFSSAVSYALIDKRDITISREFVMAAYRANDEYNRLNNEFARYIATIPTTEEKVRMNNLRDSIFHDSTGKYQFNKLTPTTQDLLKQLAARADATRFLQLIKENPAFSIYRSSKYSYDSLKTLFQNKLLWTVGVSDTTYANQFFFSNVVLSTRLLKGVVDPSKNKNLELDIQSYFNFLDDTLKTGRDLGRKVFTFEPGLNLVFKSARTQQSWLEFKLSGGYHYVFNGLYANEDRNQLQFNGTLRIRILNDVWIPLQFSYDPESGNVFGFLNVKANFSGFNGLLKGKK